VDEAGNNHLENSNEIPSVKVENDDYDDDVVEVDSNYEHSIKLEPATHEEEVIDTITDADPLFIVPEEPTSSSTRTHLNQPEAETENQPVKCNLCQKHLGDKFRFQNHNRRYHQLLKCIRCQETFTGMYSLSSHAACHYNEVKKVFPCPLCSKVFPTARRLSSHLCQTHKRHTCSVCKLSFKLKGQLDDHFGQVHNPGHHPCPHCSKVFPIAPILKTHIRNIHSNLYSQND